jgi:methionyl-tRNA synthetase
MNLNPKRYLITSALPYANGPLHIGHLAGAYLSGDIYARFLRSMDKDVVYVCGSDEHGAAITIKALKEGKNPKDIIDTYHELFQEAFSEMGISFDIYHRTSADIHHETSQEFFRTLHEKGEFIEKESEQYYDSEAKQFLADRYITGTCPKCNNDGAYGDQCESCGSSLSPTELINPKSTLSGSEPTLKTTKHWFLQLDKYEEWLKEWISTGQKDGEQLHDPADWKNHVLGQCKSWLEGGLHPRAMTRDLDWGVDVPQEIEGAEGKKLYVWMDAPIGYISATKQWAIDNDKDWRPYWQDKDTSLIHFIGKDNIVFHCLIFPAILNAHGAYILPQNVPANQFVNLEGDKLSTSRNWAVWVNDYVKELPGKQDELRYHMIKNMPEQKDSEFTWKGFQDSVNNELVNNLANFINRVIVLTNKYYDGVIPAYDLNLDFVSPSTQQFDGYHDGEMLQLHDDLQDLNQCIRTFDFRGGLRKLMEISSQGNQLLQFNEPWKKVKLEAYDGLVKVIMNLANQYVAAISIAIQPFMPFSSDKLRDMLNLPRIDGQGEMIKLLVALAEGEDVIKAGHQIGKPTHLFSRIDDEVINQQIEKLKQSAIAIAPVSNNVTPIKDTIQYDDFMKMDIRVAEVLSAKRVPKTDKLMELQLSLGAETRTVVSGIAEHFTAEEVVGRKVSYLANLAPRKLRGVLSSGMILMAEDQAGKLSFVDPGTDTESGSIIR